MMKSGPSDLVLDRIGSLAEWLNVHHITAVHAGGLIHLALVEAVVVAAKTGHATPTLCAEHVVPGDPTGPEECAACTAAAETFRWSG